MPGGTSGYGGAKFVIVPINSSLGNINDVPVVRIKGNIF